MKSREDVVQALENFPEALLKLFRGENFGQLALQGARHRPHRPHWPY